MYIWLILSILHMFTLTACTVNNFNRDRGYCQINKIDRLKYFNSFDKKLLELKIPKDLNITLPNSSDDYYIPPIDLLVTHDNIDNLKISICPPMILENIFNESD